MIVAFDYDKTWTADPATFRLLVELLKGRGHTCILVTGRPSAGPMGDQVRREIGDFMPIVFAGPAWKRDAARDAGYTVDVWVDDMPETVGLQHLVMDPRARALFDALYARACKVDANPSRSKTEQYALLVGLLVLEEAEKGGNKTLDRIIRRAQYGDG